MPVEMIAEREEPAERPPLRLVTPARDIEAEVEAARVAGVQHGYRAGIEEASKAYEHQLAQKAPRAPLALEMIPVLERISVLVGIRVMLAAALTMTFAMAWRAMSNPDILALVILVVFGLLSMGPLAWLATRRTG